MDIEVFAKTGTPRVATVVPKATQKTIEKLSDDGELQVQYSRDGRMSILLQGKRIERDSQHKAIRGSLSPTAQALDFLAKVNDLESVEDQRALCKATGAKLTCAMFDVRAERNDDGRNFASVVNLVKDRKVVCSVALAFSIVKTAKDPMPRLVTKAFAEEGPVFRRLGLAKGSTDRCESI